MITITFGSWLIPTAITLLTLLWAVFVVGDGEGYLSGLPNVIALIPALSASTIAWIIWGVFH
jgi:hypothetical protein